MRLPKTLLCCVLLLLPLSSRAQSGDATKTARSVRAFVQQFYDSYVPKALVEHSGPAWKSVVTQQRAILSPELAHALADDLTAQERDSDSIVGLDFDPFLNSQDPCERYQTGGVVTKGSLYRVDVHGICSGRKNKKPDVVAEVKWQDGHWIFVNFFDSDSTDLLSTLRELRKSREKK